MDQNGAGANAGPVVALLLQQSAGRRRIASRIEFDLIITVTLHMAAAGSNPTSSILQDRRSVQGDSGEPPIGLNSDRIRKSRTRVITPVDDTGVQNRRDNEHVIANHINSNTRIAGNHAVGNRDIEGASRHIEVG